MAIYDLIIFDVDGTLVRTQSGAEFRKTADDWELIEGRAEVLQQIKAAGIKTAIATNQAGVAMGYYKLGAMDHEIERLKLELGIDSAEACFDHPEALLPEYRAPSFYRKPMPGMLLSAMLNLEVDAMRTLMVGDREEDRGAARRAGCGFQWAHVFFANWRKAAAVEVAA